MKHILMAGISVLGVVMIFTFLLLSLRDDASLTTQQASAQLRNMTADATVRP